VGITDSEVNLIQGSVTFDADTAPMDTEQRVQAQDDSKSSVVVQDGMASGAAPITVGVVEQELSTFNCKAYRVTL